MDNFVNIVGYQLEKVHTGVIKWCLEVKNSETVSDSKYAVLSNIYNTIGTKIPFSQEEIDEINGFPEYSFGRKARIDLVVEIKAGNDKYYLACEMKVDSDPKVVQLDNTVKLANKKLGSTNIKYLLVLLGCSAVSRRIGDEHKDFHSVDYFDLIKIFTPQKAGSSIVESWLKSLEEEIDRNKNASSNYLALYPKKIWSKKEFISLGYRPYFSLYYYYYSHVRKNFSCESDWNIYSGSNNPVMNWKKGWKNVGPFKFYWEFNYLEYCFKVKIDKKVISKSQLNKLRDIVVPILDASPVKGKAAQKRYGEWNSIYKWDIK